MKTQSLVKYLIACLSFLSSLFISAQDQFLAYSIKGDVTVVTNNMKTKAKTGMMLPARAIVNVPVEGAITFICKESGMFSITRAGSYSLTHFYDSCYKKNSTVLTSYTKFIWAQTTIPSGDKGRMRKTYFHTPGAVAKEFGDIWVDPLFDTLNYSGNGDFLLSWHSLINARSFQISLYDSGNTVVPFHTITLNTSGIFITKFLDKIKPGHSCYWSVELPGEKSDELRVFNYVSKEMYDSVLATIKELKPVFEAPAEEAYRTAFMLEDAHYYAEAEEYYTKATILDTSNKLYWSTLMSFKTYYKAK